MTEATETKRRRGRPKGSKNKKGTQKREHPVWDAERLDPLVEKYLTMYEHTTDNSTGRIVHTFTLKEGECGFQAEQIAAELYYAIKHLCESTCRAYRLCDPSDIELFIDDLTPDCFMAFRKYYKLGKGKPFSYLIYLAKTRYSFFYRGKFPSSTLYNVKPIKTDIFKTKHFKTEEQRDDLIDEMEMEVAQMGIDLGYFVHVNKRSVSIRRKTKTNHCTDAVLFEETDHREPELWDFLDIEEVRNYVADVPANAYHLELAQNILDYVEKVNAGESFHQGRRGIYVALKEHLQNDMDTKLTTSDVKLAVYVIRQATALYLEDNPGSESNPSELELINNMIEKDYHANEEDDYEW